LAGKIAIKGPAGTRARERGNAGGGQRGCEWPLCEGRRSAKRSGVAGPRLDGPGPQQTADASARLIARLIPRRGRWHTVQPSRCRRHCVTPFARSSRLNHWRRRTGPVTHRGPAAGSRNAPRAEVLRFPHAPRQGMKLFRNRSRHYCSRNLCVTLYGSEWTGFSGSQVRRRAIHHLQPAE
jgi:hypothetical protein